MLKYDKVVKKILGMPNFALSPYAHRLRKLGHDIETKAEAEQSYVLYWWLCLYEKHGDNWEAEMFKVLNVKQKKETKIDKSIN